MVEYVCKKTCDLNKKEKSQICSLFWDVFEQEKSIEHFEKQFQNTFCGYSYHGLMVRNGAIVGAYSAIPFRFRVLEKDTVFALDVDTMIRKDERGKPSNLISMANSVYSTLANDGIPFIFGFPNDNIYLVRKKWLKWKDIGRLDYYVMPINIGKIKPSLSFLGPLNLGITSALNLVMKVLSPSDRQRKLPSLPIEKINDECFLGYRYSFGYQYSDYSTDYILEPLEEESFFVYRKESFDDICAAFLVDVYPLSKGYLQAAVGKIYEREKREIALIIYIGKLGFRAMNLIKLPTKFEPKKIYMAGRILRDDIVDESVFDIRNWNVNLSNYDVI